MIMNEIERGQSTHDQGGMGENTPFAKQSRKKEPDKVTTQREKHLYAGRNIQYTSNFFTPQ